MIRAWTAAAIANMAKSKTVWEPQAIAEDVCVPERYDTTYIHDPKRTYHEHDRPRSIVRGRGHTPAMQLTVVEYYPTERERERERERGVYCVL
jgi:hypothetical protein